MSIIVTAWEATATTVATAQVFQEFLERCSRTGFEVKGFTTFENVEKNGKIVQYYTVLAQRPIAWADSSSQVSYPS